MAFVSLLRCIECKIESLEGPPSHPVLPCFTVHRLLVACTHVYVTKCTTLLHCTSTPASISLYLAMHLRRSHWHSSILHPEQREIWNWIERNWVLRCACVILHIWFRKYWQTPDVHIFNDSRLMLINWFWWLIELELVAINREWESRQFWAFSRFAMTEHFESTCYLLSHTITRFVSISSRPVFLSARWRLVTFWFLEVSDMSFGRSSWNINLGANHAYLTHIGLNGKFHGRYRKNNRKRARVGRRGAHTNTALISRELKPDVLCAPFL